MFNIKITKYLVNIYILQPLVIVILFSIALYLAQFVPLGAIFLSFYMMSLILCTCFLKNYHKYLDIPVMYEAATTIIKFYSMRYSLLETYKS